MFYRWEKRGPERGWDCYRITRELVAELGFEPRSPDAQARASFWSSSLAFAIIMENSREAARGLMDKSGPPWLHRETIGCPSCLAGIPSPSCLLLGTQSR